VLYPKDDAGHVAIVDPLIDVVVGDVQRPLYLLVGASLLVGVLTALLVGVLPALRLTPRDPQQRATHVDPAEVLREE
jgi:hypothetical protein